jgi:ATP-dependent RNA helicase RhlB
LIKLIGRKLRSLFTKKPSPSGKQKKPAQPEIPDSEINDSQQLKKSTEKAGWNLSRFTVSKHHEKTRFHDLRLPGKIMHGIYDCKFEYCTPIQAEILPKALEGSDVTGRAQTGTGKSAAFLISIYTRLLRNPLKGKLNPGMPRALILAPTRELALQIQKDAQKIGRYTKSRTIPVFGGMDYEKQKKQLQRRIFDIIVATPGRLLDFKRQGIIDLSKVEILVIDEADRMLDMGFIPDIRKIVCSTPHKNLRQTMFFSATLTSEVINLASQWTKEPYSVEIEPGQIESDSVNQITYIITSEKKFTLLYNLIVQQDLKRVLVFSNTREETRNLEYKLRQYGINAALLSGEVSQIKRLHALDSFKNGGISILVATDVAARGIHVDGISHVINYNLPQDPEDYVHRIGRTGRAGATGIAVNFASEDDSFYIPIIEEMLGHKIKCEYPEKKLLSPLPPPSNKQAPQSKKEYRPGEKTRKKPYDSKSGRKSFKSGSKKYRSNNPQKNRIPKKITRNTKPGTIE